MKSRNRNRRKKEKEKNSNGRFGNEDGPGRAHDHPAVSLSSPGSDGRFRQMQRARRSRSVAELGLLFSGHMLHWLRGALYAEDGSLGGMADQHRRNRSAMRARRFATSLYNDITLSAPAFEIRWRSGDVNGQFTHPTSVPTRTSESATPKSTGRTDSTNSLSASPPSDAETGREDSSDMSAGKIAGIVVGASAAMCIIVAVAFIIRRRHKYGYTKAKLSRKADGNVAEGGGAAAELDDGAVAVVELQSEGLAKELDSNRPKQYDDHAAINSDPAELPGDSTARLQSCQCHTELESGATDGDIDPVLFDARQR
ncbi:hypothetical protein PWT90_07229 [Aphanocladium album]|nr:hypothetical protein PWT90_07229 [Aphanocladium album]